MRNLILVVFLLSNINAGDWIEKNRYEKLFNYLYQDLVAAQENIKLQEQRIIILENMSIIKDTENMEVDIIKKGIPETKEVEQKISKSLADYIKEKYKQEEDNE